MPVILNLNTNEYFIANNEEEKTYYLKKLLNHTSTTISLDWKVKYHTYEYFKSVIRWNRTDKIIIVPQNTEAFILNTFKYKNISIDNSGNALAGNNIPMILMPYFNPSRV
jgi:hypothetical protein